MRIRNPNKTCSEKPLLFNGEIMTVEEGNELKAHNEWMKKMIDRVKHNTAELERERLERQALDNKEQL